ncbi:MAG: purine-cytosine permease family protein, partial [Gaiellales bacterium]
MSDPSTQRVSAHRLPRGVEKYGVEPIPADRRTTRWTDLFAILFTWNLSPLVLVLGALAVIAGGLPVWWAAAAVGLGALLGSLFLIVAAQVGVDYGLPGQVAMRGTFGQWGARGLTSPYRIVATCYWFAAQALAAAIGVRAIVDVLVGYDLGLVLSSVVVAAIGALLAVIGFDALRYFVRVVLPLTLVAVVILVVLFLTTSAEGWSTGSVLSSSEFTFTWVGFATFLAAVWGGQLTAVMSIADFCRYTSSRVHMQVGVVLGTTLSSFIAAWIGAYAAVAVGSSSPFAAAAGLTQNKALLSFLLLTVLAEAISVNIMNVYNGGLSLVNTIPRLGRFLATAAISLIAVALSAFPDLIENAQQWFIHLGNVAAPIAGVVIVDYAVLKRTHLDVIGLFDPAGRYRFLSGLNLASIAAVGIGVAVYYAVPESSIK